MNHDPYNWSFQYLFYSGVNSGAGFDGVTFNPAFDHTRLTKQLGRVYNVLKYGRWYTLRELSVLANGPEASIGAGLRDLRKDKFGGHTVDRKRGLYGLWYYKLQVEPQQEMF